MMRLRSSTKYRLDKTGSAVCAKREHTIVNKSQASTTRTKAQRTGAREPRRGMTTGERYTVHVHSWRALLLKFRRCLQPRREAQARAHLCRARARLPGFAKTRVSAASAQAFGWCRFPVAAPVPTEPRHCWACAQCRCSVPDGGQRALCCKRSWWERMCRCAQAPRVPWVRGSRASTRTYPRRLLHLLRRVRGLIRLSRLALTVPLSLVLPLAPQAKARRHAATACGKRRPSVRSRPGPSSLRCAQLSD